MEIVLYVALWAFSVLCGWWWRGIHDESVEERERMDAEIARRCVFPIRNHDAEKRQIWRNMIEPLGPVKIPPDVLAKIHADYEAECRARGYDFP